jgi:hypothetical protein
LRSKKRISTGPPPPNTGDIATTRTFSLATKAGQEEGRSRVTRKKVAMLIETGAHRKSDHRLLPPWKLARELCR